MKFTVWIPAHDVTADDGETIEASDPRAAAEKIAERDHAQHDGWEWSWPVTYNVRDDSNENGRTVAVEVERYVSPTFYARTPRDISLSKEES